MILGRVLRRIVHRDGVAAGGLRPSLRGVAGI